MSKPSEECWISVYLTHSSKKLPSNNVLQNQVECSFYLFIYLLAHYCKSIERSWCKECKENYS